MENNTLKTIRGLRSIHWEFTDRPVAREDIQTIIEHSLRAPNNNDRADISVIVVTDAAVLNELTGGDSGGRAVPVLVYALDYTRVIACAKKMGHEYEPRTGLYNFLHGVHDVCAAAQTAVIAAKSMGIDSLITNFAHRCDPGRIKQLLNMPEEYCFPIVQLALGYTEKPVEEVTRPISPGLSIHYGAYQPPTEEELNTFIRDMDAAYPNVINESHHHALDWFFTEWWTYEYDEEVYAALARAFGASKLLEDTWITR